MWKEVFSIFIAENPRDVCFGFCCVSLSKHYLFCSFCFCLQTEFIKKTNDIINMTINIKKKKNTGYMTLLKDINVHYVKENSVQNIVAIDIWKTFIKKIQIIFTYHHQILKIFIVHLKKCHSTRSKFRKFICTNHE